MFEDWNVALEFFQKGDFMFSFDLKSGIIILRFLMTTVLFLDLAGLLMVCPDIFLSKLFLSACLRRCIYLPNVSDLW